MKEVDHADELPSLIGVKRWAGGCRNVSEAIRGLKCVMQTFRSFAGNDGWMGGCLGLSLGMKGGWVGVSVVSRSFAGV